MSEGDRSERESKAAVLARIDEDRAAWERLAGRGDAAQAAQPILDHGWSFKDVAAHVMAWREEWMDRIEADAAGLPAPPKPWPAGLNGDDEINPWIEATYRDRPAQEIFDRFSATYDRLRAIVAGMPESMLFDAEGHPFGDGESLGGAILSGGYFEHFWDEHGDGVRAWTALTEPARAG